MEFGDVKENEVLGASSFLAVRLKFFVSVVVIHTPGGTVVGSLQPGSADLGFDYV